MNLLFRLFSPKNIKVLCVVMNVTAVAWAVTGLVHLFIERDMAMFQICELWAVMLVTHAWPLWDSVKEGDGTDDKD